MKGKFSKGGLIKGRGKGVEYLGPTVTGRFSAKVPKGFNPPRAQEPRVAEADDSVVACDFSEIERRVMANMQIISDEPYWSSLSDQIRIIALRSVDKWLAYMWAYGSIEAVQTRIDEEGCGAFIAAARSYDV